MNEKNPKAQWYYEVLRKGYGAFRFPFPHVLESAMEDTKTSAGKPTVNKV